MSLGSSATCNNSTTVVSELEGTLLKDHDTFSYYMLVAFEASGLIRFTLLLLLWPYINLLRYIGKDDIALKLTIFIAVAGVRESEIDSVARAVLPKFYMDDIDIDAWRVFSSYEKKIVVTQMPRVMVERLVKEHLRGEEVVGVELAVNRFGYTTGFVRSKEVIGSVYDRVGALLVGEKSCMGLGRPSILLTSLCKDVASPPYTNNPRNDPNLEGPLPVIFHDGRLVKRPTPSTALIILLWIPFGIIICTIRMTIGLVLPMWIISYICPLLGGKVIVKGKPPPPSSTTPGGVLYVCTHRTLMDPVVLSTVLQRRVPAATYSISRLSELLSPIPTVRLTRVRELDADRIKKQLAKGDLIVCPEGTTCREPFLLRFSALFAELSDRIVPVAMNYRVEFFHPTTARGWKGLDPIFFFMNPRPIYEVNFLNQLPMEATCSGGKSPHDVANYVQRILAAALGFECTNFTRKDKYRILAGNDGTASYLSLVDWGKKVASTFKPFIQ